MTDQPTPGPFSYEERQRTGRNAGLCTHPGGYDGECLCPPSCVYCQVAARTTPDNPATSGDAADNPLRVDAEAWRRKAVRRALAISKLRGTIDACTDLADEPVTDRTPWGDGYRAAISDLREVLREFGHFEPAAAEPGERP